MHIWRLIAHHLDPESVILWSLEVGRIAIGWGETGDLKRIIPTGAQEITHLIKKVYPRTRNAHLGGPSLWHLYHEIQEGDLVILSNGKRRTHVLQIEGPYEWRAAAPLGDYNHQRRAAPTALDPDEVWKEAGSEPGVGENIRWTLIRCIEERKVEQNFREGTLLEVRSTTYERDPRARRHCLKHFGVSCSACGFNFEERYGNIGIGFIHVHHLNPLSKRGCAHELNPINDLRPVCPNCHAMIHKRDPPFTLEEIRGYLRKRNI